MVIGNGLSSISLDYLSFRCSSCWGDTVQKSQITKCESSWHMTDKGRDLERSRSWRRRRHILCLNIWFIPKTVQPETIGQMLRSRERIVVNITRI